jgi:hypothetical protein
VTMTNKDMLTKVQRRLGASLIQPPTIVDDGWWYYGEVGTPEPSYEVSDFIFVDPWPKLWNSMGACGGALLSEPSPQNAVMLIPSWGDGFERLKLLMRPYFALGWENLTANTRMHFPRCHVTQWENHPIILAEQHYSRGSQRGVPWSMFTTGIPDQREDVERFQQVEE